MGQEFANRQADTTEREIDLRGASISSHPYLGAAWAETTQDVLGLVGRKWVVPVIDALIAGPRRNFQLRCCIGDIQPKVLRETLRSLERDGIVERVLMDDGCGGKCIAYQLTSLGRSVPDLLSRVFEWGVRHLGEVRASRGATATVTDGE
jgi:DNA-binding HxlR family transcriptional regulator